MILNRDQALRLLEPYWIAREASEARLQAMLDEAVKLGTREGLAQAGALQQAGRYLAEKGRRFEPDFLQQAIRALDGSTLLFPEVRLRDEDMAFLVARWREKLAASERDAAPAPVPLRRPA